MLCAPGACYRLEVVNGRGANQILIEDPARDPVELFQPAAPGRCLTTLLKEAKLMPNLPPQAAVLLRSEETSGHVSITEIVVPAHSRPSAARDCDEAFYLLEGELIFQVDGVLEIKRAGELAFAPRNVAHALANHRGAPARYMLVCTPAGFERHWARIAAEAAGMEPPEWALQPIPDVVVAARRAGLP